MGNDWIKNDDFRDTDYGRLDEELGPGKFYGPLDQNRLPPGSSIVPDPKDGLYGIITDVNGIPLGKIRNE